MSDEPDEFTLKAGRLAQKIETEWFRQGIYEHYKGGLYFAHFLAWAHDLGCKEQ